MAAVEEPQACSATQDAGDMSRCGEAPPETAEPASIAGPATVTAPDDEAAAWLLELADQAPPVSPPPEPVPALPQIDHEIDLLFNEMDELEMIGGIDFEFPEFQDRPAPVAHYAALIEEAKVQAARRPDLFDGTSGDDQTDSPLAGLPLDVLCALGGYVDISTAATLWQTCKKLWTVGEWTTARTEFLVGQFGLDQAVEGCVHYLRLLTPFVVRAVFGRVKKLKGKIPRYQLQRLYSRAYIAGRLDLLQVAQEWAAVEYPEPLDRWSRFYIPPNRHNPDGFTQQTQHRDALVAVSSAGFSSIPDLVLLQLLAFARLLPRGLEYLLDQAIEGGWAVEDDACLSCMMTLKKAYGLSPSATLCGRSLAACTSSAAVTGSFRYYIEYGDHRSGPMDSFVPETDGVHALLAKALFEGDALAVNRLIAFGASSRPERTPTISAAANEETLDDGLFAVPAADEGARATRRRLQAMDVSCENFAVSNPYLCASEILERYYYDRHADKSRLEVNLDPFDAVQIAAMSTKVSLLRPLLELGLREGRWDTEQGRNDLRQCLKASRNSIECYDLIQNYASEKPDPSILLLKAVLNGDAKEVEALMGNGTALSAEQVITALKMGPTPKETLELLLCNSTFVGSHLERIIKPLTTCTHDREPNHRPSYETVSQRHPALLLLLQKHEGFWRGKEGTRILSFYFADRRLRGASCMCLILRPFMSTNLADYSPHNSVIRFDFRQAISMRDKAKAKQLIDYGMSPAAAFESLFDDWSPAVVNDQDMGDLAFYLTAFKPLKRETSMLLSNAVFCRCRQALELLLDAKIGHELPHVNTGMLTSILSPNMDREDDVFMFEQLIAKALQQPKMIRDWKRVEDGIKRCEGEPRTRLLRLWQTYKDNFPTNSSGQYDELDDERVSPFEDVYYY